MHTPQINDICLDLDTKDFVAISNGIPVKDEHGNETRALHATEAVVVRADFDGELYWTYISIKGHRLSPSTITRDEWHKLMAKTKGRI